MSFKPNFWKQTDKRWASKSYKGMTIGGGGCGPTSIANIVSPLLNKNITPPKVFKYMCKHGYIIPGRGSLWDGITKTLKHYGIDFIQTYNGDVVKKYLQKGYWMIGLCGPSRWTSSGHYIVIYKLTASDHILVSDPYSSSDYCQKDAYLKDYLNCDKCSWVAINPKIYPGYEKYLEKHSKVFTLYVDSAMANVRKARSIKSGVVGKLKRGTKLTLYALQNGWYKIKKGKYRGYYIGKSNLTRFEPYKHEYQATCKMNVRAGAAKTATKKGEVKKGTKLTSSKRSGDWLYFPGVKGWIRSKSADGKKEYLKKIK